MLLIFLYLYLLQLLFQHLIVTMDCEYLNFVTSTELKKVNDKKVKPISQLILKISFLALFGCVVKMTRDINPIEMFYLKTIEPFC